MKTLTQILVALLCLTVPSLGWATSLEVADCCRNKSVTDPAEASKGVTYDGHHATHHGTPEDHHQMGQMDSPLSKNQSSTGNDSFPATDGCGLITCLKLPATPVTTFYDTPKAPLPSANRLPYDPDFISRELPESIFRPPRLLTT